jgi:hypothetical protein
MSDKNSKDDKLYEDGFRDANHGGARNPPNDESLTSLFMSDRSLKENAEYHKGYTAGETSKKK